MSARTAYGFHKVFAEDDDIADLDGIEWDEVEASAREQLENRAPSIDQDHTDDSSASGSLPAPATGPVAATLPTPPTDE